MSSRKNVVIGSLIESYKAFVSCRFHLIPMMLLELLFIILAGTAFAFIQVAVTERLVKMVEFLQSGEFLASGVLDNSEIGQLLSQQAEITVQVSAIIKLFLLLTAIIFILYVIFQGLSWRYCYRAIKVKTKGLLSFLASFFALNLAWFSIIALLVYFWVKSFFANTLTSQAVANQDVLLVLIIVVVFVISYFGLISYSLIQKNSLKKIFHKTLSIGFKKAKYVIQAYLLISLLFFIINIILYLLLDVDQNIMLIAGFILVLPSLVWTKIFLLVLVKKIEKK